jgi:hypothetical protein
MQQIYDRIETTKPVLNGRTRIFVVKCFDFASIETSMKNQVWATTPGPTKKLTNAFRSSDHVILIFSVNESRSFQGVALMESEPTPDYMPEIFKNDSSSAVTYAGNFKVKWVLTCDFSF